MSTQEDTTVNVATRITVDVRKLDGARTERAFVEELAGKLSAGFKVEKLSNTPVGVAIELVKFEDWTLAELVSEIKVKLADR